MKYSDAMADPFGIGNITYKLKIQYVVAVVELRTRILLSRRL